jgi:hypothetical protein
MLRSEIVLRFLIIYLFLGWRRIPNEGYDSTLSNNDGLLPGSNNENPVFPKVDGVVVIVPKKILLFGGITGFEDVVVKLNTD